MTRTAQDLISRCAPTRRMIPSPSSFEGSLDELCNQFIDGNLPSPRIVASWHKLLVGYVRTDDPLFLIRQMTGTERGKVYLTNQGQRFKATDNAPAWWFHFALFHELEPSVEEFPAIISTVPTHFFEVAAQLPSNISIEGWHVAHVFNVKTGDIDFKNWSRADLIGRFVRNVHPCNYFFIPKQDWQSWGGNGRVVSYFVQLYKERYGEVWDEFVRMSQADSSSIGTISGPVRCHFARPLAELGKSEPDRNGPNYPTSGGRSAVSYKSSRLTFKADVIDALTAEDRFRIETPNGVFEMTKADFVRVFPNVAATRSYREGRVYSYSSTPRAALQFLRREETDLESS